MNSYINNRPQIFDEWGIYTSKDRRHWKIKEWDRNLDFYEYIESTTGETNNLQDGQRLYYVYKQAWEDTAIGDERNWLSYTPDINQWLNRPFTCIQRFVRLVGGCTNVPV